MANERKNITQPTDWWEAFQKQADEAGQSLSEWIGEAGKKHLPKDARKKLSERGTRGRPFEAQPRLEDTK